MTSKSKVKYSKMDPIQHILQRHDMYVGSTRPRVLDEYISDLNKDFLIVKKDISYCPAILRIFIEPLSNAIDNVARSEKTKSLCTTIKVNVNIETGYTSVWNDGEAITIEYNEEEDCYNHSLIFGQLLTSSNYDDDEDRYNISGRNGLGVKLTNVFSKYFSVMGVDQESKQIFCQEWSDNMKTVKEPEVSQTQENKGYTEVSWIPDFKQFKMTGYTQDIVDLYCRYVVDAAMLTNVNVYFNDVLIPVKTLKDYSALYSNVEEKDVLFINTKDAQIVIMPSTYYQAVSFVNGVYTSLGGTHVDSWVEAAFRPLVKKLTKAKSSVTYNIGDIKKFFRIFVVVKVNNPEFESQSKHKLESPVTTCIKKSHIDVILKWSVMDDIVRSKEIGVLKKLERKKRNFVKIDGLDPANNEGGKLGYECTLILVEGLAAKTYAVKGIEVGAFGKAGRDWFGIYALRGKVLNVRNANAASISKNNVVSDIIKALGAKLDNDYTLDTLFSTLRYGRILIITDADVDGIHISGLLQNMVHTLFPSLLERKKPFITSMQTPIVRVFLPGGVKNDLTFYDEREYQKYVTDYNKNFPGKKIDKKYYKGLGSSSDQDIVDTFGVKMVEFQNDENTNYNMNKIFHTKQSDARKTWLEKYDVDNVALNWDGDDQETISIGMSDFLNTEMIKFSMNDCKRSIPGLMDGLKESHRKTIFACFKRNLKYTGKSLKVAQLSGYVAEHTAYHHGEQNLYDTITRMANSYPGSNNIPLLYRDGQFGTRLSGGKDAANARYIFTKLDAMTRLLFRQEDDILLERVIDDGDVVEPVFYAPILPTILINGCTVGIGTGWSCSVPCYNPLDLINSVKIWLDHDGSVLTEDNGKTISLLPEIEPWYRGFTGIIEKSGDNRYTSWGNISVEKKTKVVDELPIGLWTDNFKEFLDNLQEDKVIKKVKNYSTPKNIRFVISEENDGIICNKENLKLHKYIYTSNMVLFDEKGCIKKYDSVDEIINSFCITRFGYYIKRKKHLIGQFDHDIKFLGNKKRFLEEVLNGDIKLFDDSDGKARKSRKTVALIEDLESRGYDKDLKEDLKEDSNDLGEDEEKKEEKNGYDYLLRLQFRSITEERINKLNKDILSNIKSRDELNSKSEKELWINDLDEFEKAYLKWLKIVEKEIVKTKK
jgi:DNA topoisomerase-2